MTSFTGLRHRFAVCACFTAWLFGCGSDDNGAGGGALGNGNAPTCVEDEFALSGTLDGEAISSRGALGNHAFIQSGSQNTLDADFQPGGRVHTAWTQLTRDGATTAITGSVTLPAGDTRGGETIDGASGSQTAQGDTVRFELTKLSIAVQCITAPCPPQQVEGSVTGCVHWKHINF